MSLPTYANEPQIQYLSQVIEQIETGQILIPDFQRPTRWTDDQRMKLLDSVTRGYPIGSLMVLRTNQKIRARTLIGHHQLTSPAETSARQYLLDGFQRMSTLFAALRPSDPGPTNADRQGHRWALGFHLVRKAWVFLDTIEEEERAFVLPGHIIFQGKELLKFQRGLKHPDADVLVDRCDEIVQTVREYKLALVPLVTESLEEATKIFGLLNTEGTRMSDIDLVSAVTWTADHDLRGRLDAARERLAEVGWEEFEERYLLAALRTAADLDIYESSAFKLAEHLTRDSGALDRVVESLRRTAGLLRDRCGVNSLGLVPYSYQAVLIADVLRRVPDPSPLLEDRLVSWFWWTTAWSSFAGISGYRMTAMQQYLRDLGEGRVTRWPGRPPPDEPTALPNAWDPRGARSRMLTIVLLRSRQLLGPSGVEDRLERQAAKAPFRGLTIAGSLSRDPGNMFLSSVEDEPALLRALAARRSGAEHHDHPLFTSPEVRFAHLINEAAWSALQRGDTDTFINIRRSLLAADERVLLKDAGRPPTA